MIENIRIRSILGIGRRRESRIAQSHFLNGNGYLLAQWMELQSQSKTGRTISS